jgi:hypothetical protein
MLDGVCIHGLEAGFIPYTVVQGIHGIPHWDEFAPVVEQHIVSYKPRQASHSLRAIL